MSAAPNEWGRKIELPKQLNTAAPQAVKTRGVERLFTKNEVAAIFGVSLRTVEFYLSQGFLPYVRIGHTARIRASDLEATLKRFTVRKGKK